MQGYHAGFQRVVEFTHVTKDHALARFIFVHQREIIEAQNHILGRHDDRLAVGGMQNVVGGHHQHARFQLGFQRQRYVNSHLVTVKVCVECRADQRMKLNSLAFNEDRLKRLNTQTVQGRSAVQQDRVLADHLVKDIPDFRLFLFNQFLGLFDRGGIAFGI